MTLYSYIVATDAGFAPNPFHEYLTLACCKPGIRKTAQKGDYVVGLGPSRSGNRVVYAMRVTDTLDFDCYWHDRRFCNKRPEVAAGGEKAVGDNIYHLDETGQWQQAWSCHSQKDGQQDRKRTCKDVGGKKVLVSSDFIYWGGKGPCLPHNLKGLIVGRAHRSKSNEKHLPDFIKWFEDKRAKGEKGYLGPPTKWPPSPSMEGTGNRRRRC